MWCGNAVSQARHQPGTGPTQSGIVSVRITLLLLTYLSIVTHTGVLHERKLRATETSHFGFLENKCQDLAKEQ